MTSTLPPLAPLGRLAIPEQAERVLESGLTVIAIHRPGSTLADFRLWVPFARAGLAPGALLAKTLFSGTRTRSGSEVAAAFQRIGGMTDASADPDRLLITGSALGTELDELLALLAEELETAAYPGDEVLAAQERFADRLRIRMRKPAQRVLAAMRGRIYAGHPYAKQVPDIEDVLAVQPEQLRELHARCVLPRGACLVVVSGAPPEEALEAAARRLGGWNAPGEAAVPPPLPPIPYGPATLVDSPGAVQTAIRLALPAVRRGHEDNAPLQLANLIFGGYFSSRLTQNLREEKGYTYGPSSVIEHALAGSTLIISVDVATEVTEPAIAETLGELDRIANVPPAASEIDHAREYALGSLVLGMSTQDGLTRLAGNLIGYGLRLDYLVEHAERLARATVDDVHRAAAAYLRPERGAAVLLGDTTRIALDQFCV